MIKETLNGAWQLHMAGEPQPIPATVPGSVYNDLLAAGRMEDPYWRDNEDAALALMDQDFTYTRSFTVSDEMLDQNVILLRCEGLDTVADLTLNGEELGHCENMHRIWEFDVSSLIQAGENTLTIVFRSPTRFIKKAYAACKAEGSCDAMVGFPHLRKAHCMFGWDWGPRLPDAGIWRDISLLGLEQYRLQSVYVTQEHAGGKVTLHTDIQVEDFGEGDMEGVTCTVEAVSPTGKVYAGDEMGDVEIPDPMLWWPHGYGEQPLYTVRVELRDGEEVIDVWERRIGLRTMTMSTQKDAYGSEFCHVVNGVKIFALGADYIPEDNILSRITPERTRALLEQCVAVNMNAIRVWGGGFYPHDFFYDICDELGLIVWQDFMFACAVYELTREFAENIRQEVIDNVTRLRHHASLGLWCGNNEMEMFVDQGEWVSSPKQKADYIRMYEYLIPSVLLEYDPATFYWPASPSCGGGFDEPNAPDRGDVHYWEVWHGGLPFTAYRKYFFRYASEFGFQSFPCLKTVESFTLPEDRNVFSYIMERHQRNDAANGKIMTYVAANYLYPKDFDHLLYTSQLLQADAIRYGVEHWRRNRGRCMGAIYWQLNDCWPVASWSSIDYFGRWKALHYAAKRFFAPVLLSCEEEGILTQDTDVNAEPYVVKKSIRLNVANETMAGVTRRVVWTLRNPQSEVLKRGEEMVTVPALSSRFLEKVELPEAGLFDNYVSYEMYEGDTRVSGGTVLFCPPKHFRFADPKLTVRREGDEIVVTARAYAKGVEIMSPDADLKLSDNYFDMNAGEVRVKLLAGEPQELRVRSVYNIGA